MSFFLTSRLEIPIVTALLFAFGKASDRGRIA